MALIALVETQADGDLVREMTAFAAERIVEAETEARTGAADHARAGPVRHRRASRPDPLHPAGRGRKAGP